MNMINRPMNITISPELLAHIREREDTTLQGLLSRAGRPNPIRASRVRVTRLVDGEPVTIDMEPIGRGPAMDVEYLDDDPTPPLRVPSVRADTPPELPA